MHGFLPYIVQGKSEISQNGANVKENLLIVYAAIYRAFDVEECGDIIVCPFNCFHDCIDVLSVDLCDIPGDI